MENDHERRMRGLLRKMFEISREELDASYYSPDQQTHSEGAELVLATSEAIEALIRNGVRPGRIRNAIFEMLKHYAEPYPFLQELLDNWLVDGTENPFRLEELHEYNAMLRSGEYREESQC